MTSETRKAAKAFEKGIKDRPFWKLVRPMLQGVKVEILSGTPTLMDGKELHNMMVKDMLTGLPSFVGEIVVGTPQDSDCKEMTELFLDQDDLIHPFIFWVYDLHTRELRDLKRRLELADWFVGTVGPLIQYVDHKEINSHKELVEYSELVITERKFPGIVLREPWGTFGAEDEALTSVPATQH